MSRITTRSNARRKYCLSYLERVTGEFSFGGSWGMGIEGFSKPPHMQEMNQLLGNKREYLFLFGFMLLVPVLAAARSKNEDGLHAQVKHTNRYARISLDDASARINTNYTE